MPRTEGESHGSATSGRNAFSKLCSSVSGNEKWNRYHLRVFLLTFTSYALLHASRKTLSTVKGSLIEVWTRNQTLFPDAVSAQSFLALLDGGFLGAYAVGLYAGGVLGDRYDPSKVLAVGMFLSAILVFLFGTVTEWLHLYSKFFYAFTWILGGLIQSVGWPTEVCVMGNWFGHGTHGAVLGLWSSCASAGNILGTLVSSRALLYGYEYAFGFNAALLVLGSVVIFVFLHSAPRVVGLPDPIEGRDEFDHVIEEVSERPEPISFRRAWLLPGVLSYSLAYACLKMVNYSFFFWLPFYLHNNFGWEESVADGLSIWYDWGGIFAAILAGVLSDKYSSRTPIVVIMLTTSMGAIFAYSKSPRNMLVNSVLMTVTGFFIGGPANLISAAISADLGKAEEIRGSAEALSTVTGIVDGTGSVGASIGQLLLPVIQNSAGWSFVFYAFIIMIFLTVLCLLPLMCKEIRDRRRFHYEVLRGEDDQAETLNAARLEPDEDATIIRTSSERNRLARRHRISQSIPVTNGLENGGYLEIGSAP